MTSTTQSTVRRTGVLLALLAGLAGWLALVERPRVSTPTGAPVAAPLLDEPADVARVELDDGAGRLTALRRADAWTDEGGRPWDGDAVPDLVETLATLRPLMVVEVEPRAPAEYGLGAGARRVELRSADGRALLSLEIGDRNPAWTGLYVRRAGRPEVLLVGAVLAWDLEKLHAAAPRPNLTTRP